jgi:acetyltransferase, GNAT family
MEFIYETNRIYINDEEGKMIAEITFPLIGDKLVDIDHTYVSNVLRGQGIAGKLMEEAMKVIEKNGWRSNTSCSYAAYWKEEHPESLDLFSQD